jgi:hypothetical protein
LIPEALQRQGDLVEAERSLRDAQRYLEHLLKSCTDAGRYRDPLGIQPRLNPLFLQDVWSVNQVRLADCLLGRRDEASASREYEATRNALRALADHLPIDRALLYRAAASSVVDGLQWLRHKETRPVDEDFPSMLSPVPWEVFLSRPPDDIQAERPVQQSMQRYYRHDSSQQDTSTTNTRRLPASGEAGCMLLVAGFLGAGAVAAMAMACWH